MIFTEQREKDLKTLLLEANNRDPEAMETLLKKFEPLLNKCAMQLDYYGAESDMTICFIEFVYSLKPEKVAPFSEGELVAFIKRAMNNKKIDLYRKHKSNITEVPLEYDDEIPDENDFENAACIKAILDELTEKQREVVNAKYYGMYSDAEIAEKMKISRQAVNQLKRRALEILTKNFE